MFFYTFLALLSAFLALITTIPDIAFIIKGNAYNARNPSSCTVLVIASINQQATSCINKEAIDANNKATTGAIIAPKNLPS